MDVKRIVMVIASVSGVWKPLRLNDEFLPGQMKSIKSMSKSDLMRRIDDFQENSIIEQCACFTD